MQTPTKTNATPRHISELEINVLISRRFSSSLAPPHSFTGFTSLPTMKVSSGSILSRLRSGSATSGAPHGTPRESSRFDLHPDSSIDDCMKSLYLDPAELSRRSVQPTLRRAVTRRSASATSDHSEAPPGLSLDELDPIYYEEATSDSTSPVVAVVSLACSWDRSDSSHLFMERIEHLDALKDRVMVRLGHMIQENKDELMKCFRDVQAVDANLENTLQRIGLSRMRLTTANDLLDSSFMQVLRLEWRRAALQRLVTAVRQVRDACEASKALKSHLASGDLCFAAESGYKVLRVVVSSEQKILSLRSIAESVTASLENLLKRSDEKLTRVCCRSFSAKEYEDVVRTFTLLDEMYEKGYLSVRKSGLLDQLHEGVLAAITDDIRSTLHMSCLEAIYLDLERSGKPTESEDLFRISGATFEEKCAAVPPDLAAICALRSMQQMIELLHTYVKITTWHSEGNKLWQDDAENSFVRSARASAAGKRILSMQTDVWECVADGLLQLLNLVKVTASVDLEHFTLLLAAIRFLLHIGKLMGATEDEKDQALMDCLEELPMQFGSSLQAQALLSLQSYLQAEDWRPFTIQFSDDFALSRILKLNPSKMTSDSVLVIGASEDIEASNLFPESLEHFEREGSPLHFSFEPIAVDDDFLLRLQDSDLRGSCYIASRSTLSGLARLVGILLRVVKCVPAVQNVALESLTICFDLHLSYIATEFTSLTERSRYFGKPSKYTAPAPAMAQEFDAVKKSLFRAAVDEYRPPTRTYSLKDLLVAAESCSFCGQVLNSSFQLGVCLQF